MSEKSAYKVLIAGGGPAALEAVLTLHELAPSLQVDLLSPDPEYAYRPLSVATPFAHGDVRRYSYEHLTTLGVTVREDWLGRVDAAARTVTTLEGRHLAYDALLLATGASPQHVIPRVITFEGPDAAEAMHGLVQDVEGGYVRSIAFVAPPGASWTLPLYELALQTAERADAQSLSRVRLTLVSHEQRPLELLGPEATDVARRLLAEAGIEFVSSEAVPAADRLVALPVPAGRRIDGVPGDERGFVPVDAHGHVTGLEGVWAAGDGTDHEPKQGGLATQQAEAAARSIAADAGCDVDPEPYAPVLQAMLLTGRGAWYFRRPLDGRAEAEASERPLWWPPTKIAGLRLGPYLDRLDAESGANRLERNIEARMEATERRAAISGHEPKESR